ncbi:CAP domain-containing protein [Streptomyces sp. NPDC012751]|uniref:CAP domain-containing protein n=1 Tax=Streptomyces sp. NPDC012751 TaxID=3364846 RepID=UPI00367F9367
MGQHRKNKHYRRIVVSAVAVGAVGVPSVALACSDWPGGTDTQPQTAVAGAPGVRWQGVAGHYPSNVQEIVPPQRAAPQTAAPQTVPPQTVPPQTVAPQTVAPSTTATGTTTPTWKAEKTKRVTVHRTARTSSPGAPRTTTAPAAPASAAPTAPASAPASAAPTAPASVPASAAPSTTGSAAPASGVAADILRLVNTERGKAGCQPLTLNATLTKAAQAHSDDMAAQRNMSHTGSDGSSPGDRITRAGYTWSSYGENVAYGYTTADQVMAGWMSSPGHRANILDCSFKEIGVGLAQPGSYWTQDFGTAR